MKIAFILPSLDYKGPIVAAKNLIKSLQNDVDYIEVFYFNDIINLDLGVKTTKISFLNKVNLDKFDIINSYMAKSDLYTAIFFKNDNRVVTTMHNYFEKDLDLLYGNVKSFIYKNLWKYALKNKKNIIVSSNDMLNYYKNLLGDSICYHRIEYGVEKKEICDIKVEHKELLSHMKEKYTILGSVGLLIKRKGYHQLIKFLSENKNYAVVIVGDGIERVNLMNEAKKYNVESRFIILGFQNNPTNYYKYFDIYMMTSYSEGCSLAMLEALSQSLPLVCSDISNHRACFSEKEVGFFELDNIKSLEEAILKVEKNIEYYKKAAYNLYKEKFSLDVMRDRHIELYKRIINESN